MGVIYWLVKLASKISTKVYFKTIYVIGQENIPKDGPVIICGNHSNQFIDPMMIMNYCEREISFTMAASSFNKRVVGTFAKLLNVIPVNRPEDYKLKGKGKVKVSIKTPKIITGINTDFIEETRSLPNGFSIMIFNKVFIVDKVIDEITMQIKEESCGGELNNLLEYEYFLIPRIDNKDLFKEVYRTLNNNGCICIFPEGTSHDRTDFLKLKAGIAHFALGAMSEDNTKNVKVVPVGLNYFNRDEFRSEVIIEFGKAYEIPREYAENFKVNKREATEILLWEIHSRMKAVTLTAPSYMELRSLLLVRKLYLPPDMRLSPTAYSELCKRFSKGYEKLKNKDESKQLVTNINKYIKELEMTGISDHEVRRMDFSLSWLFRKLIQNFILFHFFLILSLPGILIFLPFVLYLTKKAEKERLAAKAKNPNKVEALDVVASVKFQYGFLFTPIILLLWTLIFTFHFNKHINNSTYNAYFTFSHFSMIMFALIIFPFYFYFVIVSLDYIEKCKQTLYSRFLYFVFPKKIIKLQRKRDELTNAINLFVNKYIGEIDPRYKSDRIVTEEEKEIDEGDILIKKSGKRKRNKRLNDEVERFYINFNMN